MPRASLIILAGAIGLMAVMAVATATLAHSRPIRFDPAPGAILDTAPQQVTGWFTAELRRDPNWTFLHVTGPDGQRVDEGETQLSSDRRQMTVNLRGGLGPGRYVVTWRGYDDGDGAIFGDCYAFYVGQAAADEAITNKQRLDGGGSSVCARIDVEAREATPVAGGTPQATEEAGHDDEAESSTGPDTGSNAPAGDSDDGVPVWGLIIGVVAGLVAGGVGGRVIGRRG